MSGFFLNVHNSFSAMTDKLSNFNLLKFHMKHFVKIVMRN